MAAQDNNSYIEQELKEFRKNALVHGFVLFSFASLTYFLLSLIF